MEGLDEIQSAGSMWLWEGMNVLGGGENTSFGTSGLWISSVCLILTCVSYFDFSLFFSSELLCMKRKPCHDKGRAASLLRQRCVPGSVAEFGSCVLLPLGFSPFLLPVDNLDWREWEGGQCSLDEYSAVEWKCSWNGLSSTPLEKEGYSFWQIRLDQLGVWIPENDHSFTCLEVSFLLLSLHFIVSLSSYHYFVLVNQKFGKWSTCYL